MDALTIRAARADEPDVQALLLRHQSLMQATSPEESCHVMAPEALTESGAHLLAAERGGAVLGIGALVALGPDEAELKSMHTAEAARGQGVARAILAALIEHARAGGFRRVNLETGSEDAFFAARALYIDNGFEVCPPFGDYQDDPLSVFMTRPI